VEDKNIGTDQWFAEIAAPHGGVAKCAMVETAAGFAVVRKPTRPETRLAAEAGLLDPNMKGNLGAVDKLSRQCIIYPGKETFSDWIDEYPLLPLDLLNELLKLAGLGRKESAGK
jgi:hypothetical protein